MQFFLLEGEMVMPDWGTTVQSNNTTADTNTEETSNQVFIQI